MVGSVGNRGVESEVWFFFYFIFCFVSKQRQLAIDDADGWFLPTGRQELRQPSTLKTNAGDDNDKEDQFILKREKMARLIGKF